MSEAGRQPPDPRPARSPRAAGPAGPPPLGLRHPERPQPVPLPESGRLVIGSSPRHAGLLIEGAGVEPAHCTIGRLREGGWAVRDLGSAAGTLVGGERVRSRRLRAGDELQVGPVRLSVVALDPAAASSAGAAPEGPTDAAGRVGGYRIERPIGRGRMGLVYLAVQESLSRPVALKVLDPRLAADQAFTRRFRAEAETAAALAHPNVVTVHDFGEADGQSYLVMEYMPGGNLEELVARDGPLPWRAVLDVLHDIALALEYAEAHGIVHRDVKPANLMRGTGGVTKLADLGLAVAARGGEDERDDGPLLGTPHFVSPEQARGEPLDARSDLYSLGATAFRLLSGRAPFEGASAREIVRARFEREAPPLRSLAPDVPAAVEALVASLLARERDARPASAAVLLASVDRLRAEAAEAEWARLASDARPSSRWIWVAAGGLGGALLLFVLLLYVARRAAPAFDAPRPAVDALAEARPSGGLERGGEASQEPFFGGTARQRSEADPYASLESRLAELEQRAAEAYATLPPEEEPRERRRALSLLAERFGGTPTAERARGEVAALDERLLGAAALERELAGEARAASLALRRAIGWDSGDAGASNGSARQGPPQGLQRTLEAVRAFEPPPAVAQHEAFLEARAALCDEIAAASLQAVREGLRRADELAADGRFDELDALLAELETRHAPPPFVGGEALPLRALRQALEQVAARRAGLAAERSAWLVRAARDDRATLAAALGPGGGLLASLRALDLEALAARLAALEGELGTPHARAFVHALADDARAAEEALALLARSFAAGDWRRRSVVDVRSGRGIAAIAGLDRAGVRFEDAGAPLAWSAFAVHADWLHQLFHERLARAWTPAEEARIATLLRLAATAEAAEAALASLQARTAPQRALGDPWEACTAWARGDAERQRLDRERFAAARFERATRAAQAGSWALAEAEARRLLGLADRSLFVALLSDGTLGGTLGGTLASESAEPGTAAGPDASPGR